jgi:hypothetical protein
MSEKIERPTSDEELTRSDRYLDPVAFPNEYLLDTAHYWEGERQAEELTGRNPAFVDRARKIVGRATFELTMRGVETGSSNSVPQIEFSDAE